MDVLNKKIKYDYFVVYVGIASYLGRTQPAKKISIEIIASRALGYKNFADYLDSNCIKNLLSRYKINKAIEYLENADFIRTFYLKRGQIKYFSTRLKTIEELAEFANNCKNKKLRKKIYKEKLRQRLHQKNHGLEIEYEQLKNNDACNGDTIH